MGGATLIESPWLSDEPQLTSLADPRFGERTQKLLTSGDFLSGDNIMRLASLERDCCYRKMEFIVKPGIWRGRFITPGLLEVLRPMKTSLIYGHSSASPPVWVETWVRVIARAELVGTNRTPSMGGRPLPLGLPNAYPDSATHEIFGDISPLIEVLSSPSHLDYRNSIYANFDSSTHKTRRELALFLRKQGKPIVRPTKTLDGRLTYLKECRSANYVLCPQGVGEDTHRLWETLYVGSIPIVLRSELMEFFACHFPILLIDSWEQLLDQDWLESSYISLKERLWDLRLLQASTWIPNHKNQVRHSSLMET